MIYPELASDDAGQESLLSIRHCVHCNLEYFWMELFNQAKTISEMICETNFSIDGQILQW
jgi:hypothetical protein